MKSKHRRSVKLLRLLALPCALLSSCATNEELKDRLDHRNENYNNLQDRREMRRDARDARYNTWYDRAMD